MMLSISTHHAPSQFALESVAAAFFFDRRMEEVDWLDLGDDGAGSALDPPAPSNTVMLPGPGERTKLEHCHVAARMRERKARKQHADHILSEQAPGKSAIDELNRIWIVRSWFSRRIADRLSGVGWWYAFKNSKGKQSDTQ